MLTGTTQKKKLLPFMGTHHDMSYTTQNGFLVPSQFDVGVRPPGEIQCQNIALNNELKAYDTRQNILLIKF